MNPQTQSTISHIDVSLVVAGNNDRTVFSPSALSELASSIQSHGLAQPITVREIVSDSSDTIYQIVAGERRFRACTQILGWTSIPAIVADMTDEEASAIMLAENVARQDLDAIDEGIAYHNRITQFGWTVQECAARAGVSATRVRFRTKLLALRSDLQNLVRTGNLPLGYAQALADANLDINYQGIAISRLNANATPTPAWFRTVVAELLEKQSTVSLFDSSPLFSGEPMQVSRSQVVDQPATPATSQAPVSGSTPKEVVQNQIAFWQNAAARWDAMGKNFKRGECEAAVAALTPLLSIL
jgi:ParB/RepB/Spo0J family partition protein